ncbi:TipAS antibiotic-recognition domain-containing protein [Streptococcus sp. H49]|uniref:TipAS antibiotic-recognition domain-containing protein n=1 Tax=Streptococcus huangxiaojuni TaxID=3237239 RepID=UPI0034A1C10B
MKKKDKKAKKSLKIKEKRMLRELSNDWDSSLVKESTENWHSYSDSKQNEILEECENIFLEIASLQEKGIESPEIKELLVRWHKFIQHFYEPSLEVLRGLGYIYADDQRFKSKFETIDPNLPDFLKSAIDYYVDELEDIWLQEQYETLEHKNEL